MWNARQCEVCGSADASPYLEIPDYNDYAPTIDPATRFTLMKCGDCSHVFVKERLDRQDLRAIYRSGRYLASKRYSRPENWEELCKIARIFVSDIRRRMETDAPASLFEIGASYGYLLQEAARAGFRVSGLELSTDAARHARDELGLDVSQGSVEEMEREGPFDAVVALSVIEHVYDLDETCARVKRLMDDKSLFYVEVPCFDYPAVIARGRRHIREQVARKVGVFHPVEHVRYFTRRSMAHFLGRHFKEVKNIPDPRWRTHYRFRWPQFVISKVFNTSPTGSVVFTARGPR